MRNSREMKRFPVTILSYVYKLKLLVRNLQRNRVRNEPIDRLDLSRRGYLKTIEIGSFFSLSLSVRLNHDYDNRARLKSKLGI